MMIAYIFVSLIAVSQVESHGRLVEPPGRSSMWRFGFDNPSNYGDNQLFCGGTMVQYEQNGGKCGVCGDPWHGPIKNQPGPDNVYANGIIAATYTEGQDITVKVHITAHHQGWVAFKICANNDPTQAVTQECLDNTELQLLPLGTGTKYYPPASGIFDIKLKLPVGLVCTQCVMQWRYHAGNSWGCDPDGSCCVGCGNQEEFYACADVAITPADGNTLTTTTTTPATSTVPAGGTATTSPSTTTTPGPGQPGGVDPKSYVRVCYYTNWAQYRHGDAKFTPANVDPNLCTHIVYSFAKIEGGILKNYEWNDDEMSAQLMLHKTTNPSLKVLLAVGGWTLSSPPFTDMVSTAEKRNAFIDHAIIFLRDRNYDGLDLDWEYPAHRGSPASDKQKFTLLCQELKLAFQNEPQSSSQGRPTLLLTAAVAAGEATIANAYEMDLLGNYLDLLNLMAYDLHGSWESQTGHHSPLYDRPEESAADKKLNVDHAVQYWINGGFPREKIALGIPTYGRSFALANTANHDLGDATVGAGSSGAYTFAGGFLAYFEICLNPQLVSNVLWNSDHQAKYTYSGNLWVGYDDVQVIYQKCQYIKDMGLAGGMFWALDLDDFRGTFCSEGKYPLIQALKTCLLAYTGGASVQVTTPTTVVTSQPAVEQTLPSTSAPVTRPTDAQSGYVSMCYFNNLAQYRGGGWAHTPADIDPYLCTHIIHLFANISGGVLTFTEHNDETRVASLVDLKNVNPNLKILLAVGGNSMGSTEFSAMVATTTTRLTFIQHAVSFLKSYGFDGLDLHWEYPASGGSPSGDREKFTMLCQEFKVAFDLDASTSGGQRLLLTAAVAADSEIILAAYERDKLGEYLDFLNIMAYNLHGSHESFLDFHSALYPRESQSIEQRKLTVDYAVKYWISGGFPSYKISLGLPLYAKTYTKTGGTTPGSPANGAVIAGGITATAGTLAYFETCLDSNYASNEQWDQDQWSSYSWSGNTWASYDNSLAIQVKCEYIKENNLAGGMFWDLSLDDFKGTACNSGVYPLINTLKSCFINGTTRAPVIETVTTSTASAGTGSTASTAAPVPVNTPSGAGVCGDEIICSGNNQFMADPCDCNKYYQCAFSIPYKHSCATVLVWDQSRTLCDYYWNVQGSCGNPPPSPTYSSNICDSDFICPGLGNYEDPCDCTRFYQCTAPGEVGPVATPCPSNTVYDRILGVCNWVNQAPADECDSPATGQPLTLRPNTRAAASTVQYQPFISSATTTTAAVTTPELPDTSPEPWRRVCYVTSSAQFRPGNWRFTPANLNPMLCTHLILSYFTVQQNILMPTQQNDDVWMYEALGLKYRNPHLKIMLQVRGVEGFRNVTQSDSTRLTFIYTTVKSLKEIGLDGLDIAWNYPTQNDGSAEERQAFSTLMTELYTSFDVEQRLSDSSNRLILSATVSANNDVITSAYEINELAGAVDFINLMTYDLHDKSAMTAEFHSPVYSRIDDESSSATRTVDSAVMQWVNGGFPRHKIVVGIAAYGRTFILSGADTSVGAAISGAGEATAITNHTGLLAYYEVCSNSDLMAAVTRNNEQDAVAASTGNLWISFDDVESVQMKATYVKYKNLAGAAIWSVDMDDFPNTCGGGEFPLTTALYQGLNEGGPITSDGQNPWGGDNGVTTALPTTMMMLLSAFVTVVLSQ